MTGILINGPVNRGISTTVVMDPRELQAYINNGNGPVFRDIMRRATAVQDAARKQVPLGHIGGGEGASFAGKGRGKQRANLRYSIVKRVIRRPDGAPAVLVGTDNPIAMFVHEGTRPHIIRPRNAKVLRYWLGSGAVVFAMKVNHPGTRPNRFLVDNLRLALQ